MSPIPEQILNKGLHGFCLYQMVIDFLSFGKVVDYVMFLLEH